MKTTVFFTCFVLFGFWFVETIVAQESPADGSRTDDAVANRQRRVINVEVATAAAAAAAYALSEAQPDAAISKIKRLLQRDHISTTSLVFSTLGNWKTCRASGSSKLRNFKTNASG